MARTARLVGESGYLHIIIRGIGKQVLFEDEWDYKYFISLMQRYSDETEVKICAYCLMDNHVHMLIHDEENISSLFMKKIEVSYAGFYNHKYERTGHLFQDRYRSEIIYDETYFVTVLRYILRNPEKAGFCKTENYRWSSYKYYFHNDVIIEDDLIRKIFRDLNDFNDYILTDSTDDCMEYDDRKDDEWGIRIIKKTLDIDSGTVLQSYSREERDDSLRKLKAAGISVRQLERLTGLNRGIIQRA